jgi:hypothetical protein
LSLLLRIENIAYLSAGEVMPPRQNLGPAVERAARGEGFELDVVARLGHIPVAVAVAVAVAGFTAILAQM